MMSDPSIRVLLAEGDTVVVQTMMSGPILADAPGKRPVSSIEREYRHEPNQSQG
jgi:hypothetical protein